MDGFTNAVNLRPQRAKKHITPLPRQAIGTSSWRPLLLLLLQMRSSNNFYFSSAPSRMNGKSKKLGLHQN